MPQTHFYTSGAQNKRTKEYTGLPYFWLGLDSNLQNYVRPDSFIYKIVITSIVSFNFYSNLSYSSSPALSYRLTSIILEGEKFLFHKIDTAPNIPCIKRTPIPCTKYWLKMLDEMKKLKKNHL